MNYIVSCFPDEMAQSRRVGQCSDASCLVCSLKQKLGVPLSSSILPGFPKVWF